MYSFQGKKICTVLLFLLALLSIAAVGQDAAPPPPTQAPDGPPPGEPRGQREPGFRMAPPGRWWDDSDLAQRIGITSEQRQKMDDIFNSARLKLIDLRAALEKEEAIMDPLVQADSPDENKVLAQIDRVAQARAELEKANTRMLFELRHQLSHEQWVKLQAERPRDRGPRPGRRHDGADRRSGSPDTPPPAE